MLTIIEELRSQRHPRLAVIIRHGDRDKIPEGEFGNDVLLNERGIQRSECLGKLLREYRINKIYTSPVARCAETARHISSGYNSVVEIIESKALGDPGLHVTDVRLAGPYYLEHGFFHIMEQLMNGEEVPGHADLESLRMSLDAFIQEATVDDGITLFITHDSLVALYAYATEHEVYTPQNWVKYLDGVIRPVY